MDTEVIVRKIRENELDVLEIMLYNAIYQPEGSELLPFDFIMKPEIYVYIRNFFKKEGDFCLVAESNSTILGAVWVRIVADDIQGYGNIDPYTPEFIISVLKEYRNKGIGTQLMIKMIELLQEHGYKQASLSVSKENYAVRIYQNLGFQIIDERETDYLMVLDLETEKSRS